MGKGEAGSSAIFHRLDLRREIPPLHDGYSTTKWWIFNHIFGQFGLTFWSADGGINHNLRTAVIDAAGRVQTNFIGNKWTSDELVAEMVKAAMIGS
jgi:hypothetical protein